MNLNKVNLKLLSEEQKEKIIKPKGFMVLSSGLVYYRIQRKWKKERKVSEGSFEKIMAENLTNLRKYRMLKITGNSTNSKQENSRETHTKIHYNQATESKKQS